MTALEGKASVTLAGRALLGPTGGLTLAGSASLTTRITLTGSATLTTSATGDLSTAIRLAGTADIGIRGRARLRYIAPPSVTVSGPGVSLSDDLPLRTTADWGQFARPQAIPEVYGDLSQVQGQCIRYDTTGRLWCAGNGAVEVVRVWIAGEPASGLEPYTVEDASGRLITLIDLGAPAPDGAVVTAAKRGRRHPRTGVLLENPGEILWDLLNNLCAIPVAESDLDPLRAQCARQGLRIANELADNTRSIRSQVDEIAAGIGMIWTDGLWRLYPEAEPATPRRTLTALDAPALSPEARADDTAGRVQVRFDYQPGTGEFAGALTRGAYDPPYGDQLRTIESRWIRDRRSANALAERHLRRLAGHRLQVGFTLDGGDVHPGDTLALSHPRIPTGEGVLSVLETVVQAERVATEVSGEILYGQAPSTRLLSVTAAFPAQTGGALEVAYDDGVATFTILDPKGDPAVGADVSLDGGYPLRTNQAGQVAFTNVSPGTHAVAVELVGYLPMEIEVFLA